MIDAARALAEELGERIWHSAQLDGHLPVTDVASHPYILTDTALEVFNGRWRKAALL